MYIRRVSTRRKISGESYFTHKVLSADTNEVRLYCHSPGREQKEVAIVARLTRRFEEGLAKLCQSIAKPRGERRLVKITERVGRLKQKCRGVAQHYRIEYQMDDAGKKITALTWTKQPISGTQMSDPGVYCLRSILRVQRRVTRSFKMRAGPSLTVRKASQPEAELAPLYTALALDPNPGGTKKLII